MRQPAFPLAPKLAFTAFVLVLVPVYWTALGPANFLWFSDIALFGLVLVLWFEHRLLAGMMALAVFLPELAWSVDYVVRLVFGVNLLSASAYMFDRDMPRFARALSLFHLALPPMLLWCVARLGYDRRALTAQTALCWVVLPLSRLLPARSDNVNWVWGFGPELRTIVPPAVHLPLLMLALPLVVYLPTHFALARLFGGKARCPSTRRAPR